MSFDNLLSHLSRHRLIYAGVLVELLSIGAGYCLSLSGWWLMLEVLIVPTYFYLSWKNKAAVNKDSLLVESYKSQTKTLFENLNRLFESTEEQNLAQRFYNKLIQDSIMSVLEALDFMHDPGIRVSLYSHSGKGFTLLYRHSDDPEFQKKGRAFYPDNEGIIGNAYHKNKGYVKNIPDPNLDEKAWVNAQMDPLLGAMIDETAVKHLTMKSRNLFALPIRSGLDKHVIIVFESLKEDQLHTKLIEKVIASHHGLKLKEVLSMYRMYIEPSLEYAKRMGM